MLNIMETIYAVIIGTDRISNNSDIDQIKNAGLLNNITSILDLQINMGANKTTEMQSSNIAFLGQYQKLAIREFGTKGITMSIREIKISKFIVSDGSLFIVAK
jgi:hypothetical protein